MVLNIPIENSEIPQTGLEDDQRGAVERERSKKEIKREVCEVTLDYNAHKKIMKAKWNAVPKSDFYNYQFYTSSINPQNTLLKDGISNNCSAEIGGLPSGQRVFFRVRIMGWGLGPWSSPVEMRVP